ncbi:hypothetical protein, partial [Pyxidicoccus caerfyrddinensis]|uniref:hypothetical protein n=1 Tax=Pyxidicoccus caerfyrddinensis TaxID=2709663 RepID=UPI001966DDF5
MGATGVFLLRQGAPEGFGRFEEFLPVHLLVSLRQHAHPLRQRAPHQRFAHPGAAGHQRPVLLSLQQHLAHQGPRRTAGRQLPFDVRVPVQEGEGERA